MTYKTIGELVTHFKTTPRTLRHYEALGITGKVHREPNGKTLVRLYDQANIDRLDVAFHLTHYGTPLYDIVDLLNGNLDDFSAQYDAILCARHEALVYDIAQKENALFDLEGEMASRGVK